MTADDFVETAKAKGWFVQKWEDGSVCRVIAAHDTKDGLDICLSALTDADGYDRAAIFAEATKRL